jgi:hypothetical protein
MQTVGQAIGQIARVEANGQPAESEYLTRLNSEIDARISKQRAPIARQMIAEARGQIDELQRRVEWLSVVAGIKKTAGVREVHPSTKDCEAARALIVSHLTVSPTALSGPEIFTLVHSHVPSLGRPTVQSLIGGLVHKHIVHANGNSSARRYMVLPKTT